MSQDLAKSAGGFAKENAKRNTNSVYTQRFNVSFEYPVFFTQNLFAPTNSVFVDALERFETDRRHKFLVFLDDGVTRTHPGFTKEIEFYADHHADRLQLIDETIIIPGGETCKNDPSLVEKLHRKVMDLQIDRHSYIIGIGGGAILDLVGYVAATAHRGIRHIRIPTTVLAQNDSGVGVKNGYNAFGVKNFIGTFSPPFAVLNDFGFINSLPDRDKIAGMAEAVKVSLIRDSVFFDWLESNYKKLTEFEPISITHMIKRCAELHMHHIATGGDPFELGSARPLDYGHWSAHRLESMSNHSLRHGEAVAIGLALDSRYAVLKGLLTAGEEVKICNLLENLGFNLWHELLKKKNAKGHLDLLEGLREFREHLGGDLTITLLREIGVGIEVNEIDVPLMTDAIGWLENRGRAT